MFFSMVEVRDVREGMTAIVRGVVSKSSSSAVYYLLVVKFSRGEKSKGASVPFI